MKFFRQSLAIALLISLPSGVYAAAERRVQLGFASCDPRLVGRHQGAEPGGAWATIVAVPSAPPVRVVDVVAVV